MSYVLFIPPRFVAVDETGAPISGAQLWFYRAGTEILADTYNAKDGPQNTNPLISNSAGLFGPVYLDPAAGYDYKVVLRRSNGTQVWAEDDVPASAGGAGGGSGTPGASGLSVAELTIYRRDDETPTTPAGGSFDFSSQSLTAPDGWFQTIPSGAAPVWASSTVAAVIGATGTDVVLSWSTPVKVLSDGSSVNIIFRRAASQPSIPAPSSGIPNDWYDDVSEVPVSSDKLWSSVGTRPHAGSDWIWQLPIQVEGDAGPTGPTGPAGPTGPTGPAGDDVTLYYIKPLSGTAIKNGSGTLTVEAHRVDSGGDVLLSSGTIKLYVGSTVVTEANGYAAGSDGFTGVFDSGDISGSALVTLKDGPSGNPLDTITLVDVVDGTVGGVGTDAVYGYVEADGPLAWVRDPDETTWNPSGTTRQLDCTFVQSGSEVARVAWVITRDSSGILTGAAGTHTGGDLNGSRVTVTELGESSQVMTVRFTYDYTGDVTAVSETVLTSLSGTDGAPGDPGDPGAAALTLQIDKRAIFLHAYANGDVVSFDDAEGYVTVWSGTTDVTASATLSATATGCTGTVNTTTDTPVNGYAKGYFRITAMSADTATLLIEATYGGDTVGEYVTITRTIVGYEIVGSLPATNLFQGRIVLLTTDNKLYRYTGSAWTSAVPTVDLTGVVEGSQIAAGAISAIKIAAGAVTAGAIAANAVTADKIMAGSVTAAKISVTSLSSLSANIGTVTAGVLQSASGGARVDLSNARVIFNSAPGSTGGMVRVQGGGFGPGGVYLDWYGPKPTGEFTDNGIVANLTDAAAFYYLKVNGSSKSVAQRIRGEFEPKAWCNFNGSTLPPTIRDRYNISTVTRFSTGVYVVTFAEALANANYVVTGNANVSTGGLSPLLMGFSSLTTTGFNISTRDSGNSEQDAAVVTFIVFGSNVSGGSNVTQPSGGTGGGTIGWGNLPSNYNLP